MNYQEAIAYLQSFPDSERGLPGNKPTRHLKTPLSTMQLLLASMGNPQNRTKTIHITGSKGKGSTATFITNILQQAGFSTALFTSPHLHSYTERFAFDLQPISENEFAQGVTELQPFIQKFDEQGYALSTFSLLTALFFHLVSKAKPAIDWQIVEVGLGGQDDATNVFSHKEAVVITPISLEHTAILGESRQVIATNKAGIITPGCITILAAQNDPAVEKVISAVCLKHGADLITVSLASAASATTASRSATSTSISTSTLTSTPSPISGSISTTTNISQPLKMAGDHQIANALTAKTLAYALAKKGHKISDQDIERGLSCATLPGRFEIFPIAPMRGVLPTHTIVLDGAHNGDSANALANTLKSVFPGKKITFIIGVNQDKNLEDIWLSLKDIAANIIATRSDSYRAMPPDSVKERILSCDAAATVCSTNNIDEAFVKATELTQASESRKDQNIICLCGSLYLVAEARTRLLNDQPSCAKK